MTRDLVFWKQKPGCTLPAAGIYRALLDGSVIEDLETMPAAQFLERIEQRFPGLAREGGLVRGKRGTAGTFELLSSNQHVRIRCHRLSGADINTIIDAALEFGCPLYDPQEDKRFDEWTRR